LILAELSEYQPIPHEALNDTDGCALYSVVDEGRSCRITGDIDRRRNLITAEVSRRCLDRPRWVRVAVMSSDFVSSDDFRTFTIFDDAWGQASGSSPAFSPRIHSHPGRVD
jgi:hypothetical protein